MQQYSRRQIEAQRAPHDHHTATWLSLSQPSPHQEGKDKTIVRESCVEQKNRTAMPRKKYYVPTVLRTGILLAFCVVVFIVFVLLQAASIVYIRSHGFERISISSSDWKRNAYPQTSDASCSTLATCAPAPITDIVPTLAPGAPAPGSFTKASPVYFFGAYAPTLLAILLSVWWKCVFARLKEMEPYYQLANLSGASSKDSLFLSYSTDILPVALAKSLRSKHRATFFGAANMLLLTIVTLLAAETLHLIGVGDGCGVVVDATGDSNEGCEMQPIMRPVLGFILGAVLLAVLLSTVLLMLRLRRFPSGLLSEATSITGIASLSTPALARESPQLLQIPNRRFALEKSAADGTQSIIEITPAVQQPMLQLSDASGTLQLPERGGHREMRPVPLTLFFLYQIAILVLIVYYCFVSEPGTNDPIEEFLDSETFGVRLFMTGLGLGIKFYWGWIEKYVRQMSPYVALAARGGAPAQKSVLMTTSCHPITAVFKRTTWKHGVLGPVTLMAVLSEILVVTLNTIPFTDTTAYTAFQVSAFSCIILLGLMILTTPIVIWWTAKVRKNKNVAEAPACIAEVIWMAGDTNLWRGLSGANGKERAKMIESWDVQFATKRVHERWQIVTLGRGR